jgi:crossover junction endodeoxyribonuclease RusA
VNLILPWPPSTLSPNARQHHMAHYVAKRAYRTACAWSARQQGATRIDAKRLDVALVFVPPSKRRYDPDNCLARMKSGIDGLADVLGVDDSRWRISFEMSDEVGGMVRVKVQACE